jgi:hypothetical protein
MCWWRKTNPYQLSGEPLVERARKTKVYIEDVLQGYAGLVEPEIRRRIVGAERSGREHRLWIVALVSAAASAISALGAWFGKPFWEWFLGRLSH